MVLRADVDTLHLPQHVPTLVAVHLCDYLGLETVYAQAKMLFPVQNRDGLLNALGLQGTCQRAPCRVIVNDVEINHQDEFHLLDGDYLLFEIRPDSLAALTGLRLDDVVTTWRALIGYLLDEFGILWPTHLGPTPSLLTFHVSTHHELCLQHQLHFPDVGEAMNIVYRPQGAAVAAPEWVYVAARQGDPAASMILQLLRRWPDARPRHHWNLIKAHEAAIELHEDGHVDHVFLFASQADGFPPPVPMQLVLSAVCVRQGAVMRYCEAWALNLDTPIWPALLCQRFRHPALPPDASCMV
eukprot:s119_g84.t1